MPDTSATASVERAMTNLETVYFDFDQAAIRADAKVALRSNAGALRGAAAKITIAGNTDERGSEEYNQALGQRRASAVKHYLEDLGVPRSQMRIISYGETRPVAGGHSEDAWRYNRNAQFVSNN
jgi:peptidoglycan-associated lipoprotein